MQDLGQRRKKVIKACSYNVMKKKAIVYPSHTFILFLKKIFKDYKKIPKNLENFLRNRAAFSKSDIMTHRFRQKCGYIK